MFWTKDLDYKSAAIDPSLATSLEAQLPALELMKVLASFLFSDSNTLLMKLLLYYCLWSNSIMKAFLVFWSGPFASLGVKLGGLLD